jgi:LPXTG-site transpeptidase (sortase) family protein
MVAFVLAMMVLPLATPSGVAAEDDDKPKIKLNGNTKIVDVVPDPTPTPSVPITLPDDLDLNGGDDEPDIEIPGDIDIPVEDDDPQIDLPADVDVFPEPPVIDLPDCVDTDGGEVIYLPGGIDLVEARTVSLPDGVSLDLLQESPWVADVYGELLSREGATINLPPGVDLDLEAGRVLIPECEDEDERPVITVPPGFEIDLDGEEGDPPVIQLPPCVEDEDDGIITFPDGSIFDVDPETGDILLPPDFDFDFDFQFADRRSIGTEEVLGDVDLSRGIRFRLPEGVDFDGDDSTIHIPLCDDEDPPVIKLPPGIDIGVEDETPVIDLPTCVGEDEGAVIRFPPGVELDIDGNTIRLPAGVDLDFGDNPDITLPPDFDLDLDGVPFIRLPEGVEIDLSGDAPIVVFPSCDEEEDEPGYVTIHKYGCGSSVSIENPNLEVLRNHCEALEGVTFNLHNTNVDLEAEEAQTTDSDGLALWTVEKPNHLTITETIPAGYINTVVVFCGVMEGDDPELLLVDAPGGVLNYDLEPGQQVYCDWFNKAIKIIFDFPTDENGVVIVKHACPEGFDAYNSDPDGLAANCDELQDGVTFNVTDGGPIDVSGATGADGAGTVVFDGLDSGEYFISEEVPAGYGKPVVYCAIAGAADGEPSDYSGMDVSDEGEIFSVLATDDVLWCHWFNVPGGYEDASDGGDVVIYKFECPVVPDLSGFDYDSTPGGCVPLPGIEFTLSYGFDSVLTETTSDAEAAVGFHGLPAVTVSISEALPAGYGDPIVTCLSVYQTESGPVQDVYDPNLTGTSFAYDLKDGERLYCFWLNIPYEEDGSITIVKYTCAPGYDLYAQGANPEYDCPDTTDGVVFSLDAPVDGGLQGVTGVSGPGTLTFDGLPAGSYTIYEQVPAGTDEVFVLSCQSEKAKWIQGYPLSTGSEFALDLLGGDHVTCFWYNVPDQPDYGTITVVKYACPTPSFSDADDCERYEGGASFHLTVLTGNGWVEVAEGTTNGSGVLRWTGLEPGTYELDEIGGTWCYASADRTDADGNLVVVAGEETTVWVYNCGQKVVTKKPSKFPNTGVGRKAGEATGAFAPVSPAGDEDLLDPTQWMGVFDGRLIAPFLSAAKPVALRIDAIGVDARVETLEIVDGGLQDPTTADQVAWYKDTAKLGAPGNVVMAGHLNYWGVPEGVFFRLGALATGDEIRVVAQDGTVYRYQVEWVKQIDAVSGDVAGLVGETEQASLTLITCGGEWNVAAQEYDHRTVVRAALVTEA